MAELHHLQREIASLGRAGSRSFSSAGGADSAAGRNLGLALANGTRVLDLVTGLEGVIISGAIAGDGSALYQVRLAGAAAVEVRGGASIEPLPANLVSDLLLR